MKSEESKNPQKFKKIIFVIIIVVIAIFATIIAHHYKLGTISECIILCISFLVTAYLLFFDHFVRELGNEAAQMMFIQEKTEIVEQVKSELTKENIAYEVDYNLYYTEKTKAIIDLYKKLVVFYDSCKRLTSLWEVVQERGQALSNYQELHQNRLDFHSEASHELTTAIDNNRLFLNDELISELNDFYLKTTKHSEKFWRIDVDSSYDKETLEQDCEMLYKLGEKLDKFAEALRSILLPKK